MIVIIKLHIGVIFRNTFSLNKKVSSILVMIVIIKLHIGVILRNIFSLNRKVSSILAMIVIIKLHIRVIFRNTFSLNTKQEVINYPCNDCDYQASYWSHLQKHIQLNRKVSSKSSIYPGQLSQ